MMVRLILLLLNLLAVNAESPTTTNVPETSSYSVDESTLDPPHPAVSVWGDKESLKIEWVVTGYNVTGYTVSVIPQRSKGTGCERYDEVHSTSISAGESETTIFDLAPYYDYQVSVTMKMVSGKEVTAVAVASTLEDNPPAPVVNVRADNTSLHVKWNSAGCIAANVTGYTVSVIPQGPKGVGCREDEKNHSITAGPGESEVTISDLVAYYDYQVNVTVNTESGKQATGVADALTSEEYPPAPVVNVRADNRSLHVKWNIAGCTAANVTGYKVSVIPQGPKVVGCGEDEKNHSITAGPGESEVTISDLAAYYDYQVNVTVYTESGKQATGVADASTFEEDPPAPVVNVRGDNRSLHVKWNSAGCIAANVTGYKVSVIPQGPKGVGCGEDVKNHSITAGPGESEVTISDLAAYYDYQVNVTVNTESGKQATGVADASTSEEDPPSPVVKVRGDNRSLHVKWNIAACIAANVTGYTVSVIPNGPKGVGCGEDVKNHSITAGPGESEVTISDLAAYYDYEVNVTVYTESGTQATGVADASTFEEDPPAPVVKVRADNRSLHVKWNSAGCIAANVTGYTVSVIPQGPKGVGCGEDEKNHSITAGPGESDVTISDLAPYYDYQVNVTVYTESGKQATGVADASTFEEDPPAPVVNARGDNRSLHVKWNSAGCIAANVTGYNVSVIPQGPKGVGCGEDKKNHSITAGPGESEVTISDLAPYYDYQVNVTVNTESGKQATGVADASTTEDDPPAPVVNVRGDNRSLHVKWNSAGCIAANVTGYKVSVIPQGPKGVRCGEDEKNHSITAGPGESEVTISDLAAYYDYQVNVTVYTESGKQATGVADASTSEDDPPAPVVNVRGDNRSLHVKWNIAGCIAANVTGYTVSAIPQGPKGIGCGEDEKNHSITAGPGESEVTITDLAAYYDYQVNVMVYTESGKQATGVADASTLEDDPLAPVVNVRGDNRSLHVKWNIAGCIAANVTGYTVSVIPQGPKGVGCGEDEKNHSITAGPGESEVTISDLAAYYDYQVNVTVYTESGKQATGVAESSTTEELPPPPRMTREPVASSKTILVEWEQDKCVHGSVLNFNISISLDAYLDENECDSRFQNRSEDIAANERMKTFKDLKPHSTYTVRIAARTGAGLGPPLNITTNTAAYSPEPVTGVHAVLDHTNATVSWTKPCRFYGTLVKYKVSYTGTRQNFENHKDAKTTLTEDIVVSLRPEYFYNITVTAINDENLVGALNFTTIAVPANIPQQARSLSPPDPYATDDPTTKASFTFYRDMFDPSDGCVRYYAILVAEVAKEPESGSLVPGEDCRQWTKPDSIRQATPPCWNPFPGGTCKDAVTISYIIGDNDSCSTDYCNEPLTPGSKYYVTVRGYTESTFADAQYVTLETDTPVNVGLIVGVVLSVLLLGCCALTWVLYHRGALSWPPKMLLRKGQVDAQPKPVSLTRFPAYSDYMLAEPTRISNEYHMLQTFSKDIAAAESCSAALQPDSRRKNRYSNILPFDSTRVVLDPLPEEPSSDYINASFIRGYSRDIEYIATQGPKEETCFDFWRMVYQHSVKIIVMLTNLEESGKVKCYKYFPSLREHLVFGDITIRCTTELVFPIYTTRTFQLLKDDRQRSLIHLHFREWPDFGCPSSPDVMLHFSQTVRHQTMLMQPCLTVVHCSAGVGRTGTLITIDILLQHIREHKKVDIFGTVFNLRRQRVLMVQSEAQYVYIYHCIKEALLDPSFLETGKDSTSSNEPIYENVENGHLRSTELQDSNRNTSPSSNGPIYENGHVRSIELQDSSNAASGMSSQGVYEDVENETYRLITGSSVQKPFQSECEL